MPGGWPKGGTTRLELPNRHLEYALTWYGLAAALIGVFAVFASSVAAARVLTRRLASGVGVNGHILCACEIRPAACLFRVRRALGCCSGGRRLTAMRESCGFELHLDQR